MDEAKVRELIARLRSTEQYGTFLIGIRDEAADALEELLAESDALKKWYAGDCYICHHDARASLICSRCGSACHQCRANRAEAELAEARAALRVENKT